MNTPDAALTEVRRPIFGSSLWVPMLLVLLGAVGIAFEGYQVIKALRESATGSMRAQGQATAREITGFIDREQERLSAFVAERQDDVRKILSMPDDWPRVDALQQSLKRMFRGAIAFSVTGPDGRPLFEDFDGLVGPICQASMREFAHAVKEGRDGRAIPPIHPVPDAYHFDLITPWTLDDGESGLFFVSMSPQRIAELLAAAQEASGNRLVLVNRDEPTLIEVTGLGARDALHGNFRLPPEALSEPHFATDVPGTSWRLVVLPDAASLAEAERDILVVTGLLIAGLVLISVVLLIVIRREERRSSNLFMRSLQSSVSRQRAILQSMVDGLVTVDAHGQIHNVNNALTRLFGYDASELIGRNVSILMPEPFQGSHDRFMESYLTTGESKILGKGRELVARRKDGSIFPVLLTLGESLEGDEHMFVGILHDMTAYNEAQRKIVAQGVEIKRSNEELERISQMASSSLQSPLQRIASLSAAIGAYETERLDPDAKAQLRDLADEARGASDLVQGLVDYTRAGRNAEREAVDLDALMQEIRHDLAGRIAAAGGELTVAPLGRVFCDRKQAYQLFWNLLDNALRFADPDRPPEIRIAAVDDAPDDTLKVTVTDNGIGISEQALEKVFEAFYRVDPDDPRAGAGLGLSFCRKIVEAAGGRIEADSEPGEGSVFTVSLPRAD